MSQDRFIRETREEIRRLSDGFVDLEVDDDPETLEEMFRTAHNMKGTLSMEGYDAASELAHAIEDVLEGVRSGDVDPQGEVIDAGLEATDTLQSMLTEVIRHGETGTDPAPLIADLRELADASTGRGGSGTVNIGDRHVATTDTEQMEPKGSGDVASDATDNADTDDMSAEEALNAVSEFDDIDAATERMDDISEEFDELEGGGSFNEMFDNGSDSHDNEVEAAAGSDDDTDGAADPDDAAVPFDDEESVESGDAFIWIKEGVDKGETSVDELQSEIEAESFGEFDEEDDMSIQELLKIEPDEAPPSSTGTSSTADVSASSAAETSSSASHREIETKKEASPVSDEAEAATKDTSHPGDAFGAAGSTDDTVGEVDTSGSEGTENAPLETAETNADTMDTGEDEQSALSRVLAALGDNRSASGDEITGRTPSGTPEGSPRPEELSSNVSSAAPTGAAKTSDSPESSSEPAALSGVNLDGGEVDLESASFSSETGTEELESRFEGLFGGGEDEEAATEVASTLEGSSLPTEQFRRGERERLVGPEGRPAEIQTLSVDVEYADELLSLAERLSMHTRELSRIDNDAVAETAEALRAATNDLQRTVMDVRLMPLETVTGGLDRVVRDIARETGTQATLEVEGSSIQLDRSIIDRIGDPIVHLVRNAVDHGIEDPDRREESGKPRTGTITVNAERTGDDVVIEIEDDGSGVDVDAVQEAAVEANVVDPTEADQLSRRDVLDLLFHPGLSTSGTVTETSGRGVGLDVVKQTVTALGGSVAVESTPGHGTLIRLEVPVSVVVAEVLFVEAGGQQYALPLQDVQAVGSAGGSVTGGQLYGSTGADRTVDLAATMGHLAVADQEPAVIRVEDATERLAIECDAVLDRREVVITPYDDLLAGIPGINGATTGSDGQLIHVLDIEEL